ncbi:hypothetical protein FRC18_005867 [Serendipita sp. 400]|nr:hypothetical protein FRC18_005867 [Serendipita sp. 400]
MRSRAQRIYSVDTVDSKPWLLTIGITMLFVLPVTGLSFSYSAPKSCEPFNISWNGGRPPFYIMITPPSGTPRNISAPEDAWNGVEGSYSFTLNLTAGQNFILSMSDATGFGAGGNSDLLSVGGSSTNAQCNTTDPGAPFTFRFATAIEQCGQYSFSDYSAANEPVTIRGIIPVGTSFELSPPEQATSFSWSADIATGSRILFYMVDNDGRISTTSPILQVTESANSTCIDESSPHSTISSVTQEPTSPTSTSTPSQGGGGKDHTPAIIGGSVAGGLALLTLIALIIWTVRRRRDPLKRYKKRRARNGPDGMRPIDLAPSTPDLRGQGARLPPLEFEPQPFILPPARSTNGHAGADGVPLSPTHVSNTNHGDNNPGQTGMSKSMAGPSSQPLAPPRFVLHTDAGSIHGGALEQPPTYNAASQNSPS